MQSPSPLRAAADFAERHRALLREVVDRFFEEGWPTREALGRAALRRGDDVDVFSVLRELPAPLGFVDHDGVVRLTVRGLNVAPRARALLHQFVRALWLAGARLTSDEPHPKLRRADISDALGVPQESVAHLSAVLLNEAWMLGGGSGGPDDEWERDITEHTRFVIGVTDVDDYLRVEAQQRWPAPASTALVVPSDVAVPAGMALELAELHPLISGAAADAWSRDDWSQALQHAWFALRDLVRQRLDEPDLDGFQLMQRIGETDPKLPLTPMTSESERDMHRGVVRFLTGIAMYVRNPQMHETDSPVRADRTGALERLAIMSLCARHVESAASPVAVEQAVREASQPLFPPTEAAADDLIRTIPSGRLGELVAALIDATVRAVEVGDVPVGTNTCRVVHRALRHVDAEHPAVAIAAQRAGELIADDETLPTGILLLTPLSLRALAPRHRDKVVMVLIDDVRKGRINRGTVLSGDYSEPTIRLLDGFDEHEKAQLLGAVQESLATDWERQAYSMRIAAAAVAHMRVADAGPLLSAMATAIVRDNPWDAADELEKGLEHLRDEIRCALRAELLARADEGGPGADLARRVAPPSPGSDG